jgi:2-isopropylmalate synthase
MADVLKIHDATIGEGERVPGCAMNPDEKLRIARQIERLRVSCIDAGEPMASPEDFEAVRRIATGIEQCAVSARCLPIPEHIDRAWEALQSARSPRLCLIVDTAGHLSPEAKEQTLKSLGEAVAHAFTHCSDVAVHFTRATSLSREDLLQLVQRVVGAGATTVVLADGNGCALPENFGAMFRAVREKLSGAEDVVLGALCRNDLGLAVANSLSAVRSGAREIVCSIHGLGERAGIAPLEEVALAAYVNPEYWGCSTDLNTEELAAASRLVGRMTGMPVPRMKPIVGSGVFQYAGQGSEGAEGSPARRLTPELVGMKVNQTVLGKNSGPAALQARYAELGCTLSTSDVTRVFPLFKQLAQQKRDVLDEDLFALLEGAEEDTENLFHLEMLQVHSGTHMRPTATVEISRGEERFLDSATGDGPVDAAYKAIGRATGMTGELTEYLTKAVSGGGDALVEVFVRVRVDGIEFHGRGVSTDVIESSARGYLETLNRAIRARRKRG